MTETLEEYKEYVKQRLAPISEILTNIAAGDFSKKLDIPEQEDEFSELYVGLVFMMEDLQEHLKEREQAENELERNKQMLEKTVTMRTKDLTRSNEQLQREISERKHAEVALRESEEKYRNLVERANDGIAIIQDAIIKYINPRINELMGYEKDEILGHEFTRFIAPDELPKVKDRYMRRMKGEKVTPIYETKILHKNGNILDVELNAGIIKFEGKPGDLVLIRDIGERKSAEEKLKKSEEELTLLFNNISDVIFTVDSDFKLSRITPTVENMSGYKPEEVIGRSIYELDFMTEDSMAIALTTLEQILAGEDVGYLEYEFVSTDGTKRLAEVSYNPIFIDGEFVELICVARDITERKLAEEKLRDSEEMYRTLVKTLPDAVTSTDLDGNLIYVSARTLELHGYESEDELLGESAFKFIHPDCHELALKNLQKTLEKGFKRNLEYTMMKKDGSTFTGLLSAALIKDAQGQPRSFIAAVRDISERKRVEEQIKDSLEEKDVLLREIHHRVKNNIQVITSMLNLHTGYVTDKKYIESIREIQNRIRTMALIHEKLYKSKDLAHIDTYEYIKDLVNSLFRVYGINIDKIKPEITVDNISLDIDMGIPCGLIINELVSNSLKHAFSDIAEGKILIDIKPLASDREKISLTVSDNGSGFPENINFKNTDTLGLQLVNTLVDQLDGTIELDPDGKTEFKIVFAQEKKEVRDNA